MAKESETRGEREHEPKDGRPGPADHGRTGGMAPREKAPELTGPAHYADQEGADGRSLPLFVRDPLPPTDSKAKSRRE
jgi:hypothetical protein